MYVIGVTGGIGSGKSAVSDYFASLGVTVVDADIAARIVVEPGKPALTSVAERFGEIVIAEDGLLNRKALRDIVFSDPAQRAWLEKLLHPLIYQEITQQLANANSPYVLLVSPLLVETGQNRLTHRILVVDVPEELQIQRTVNRDNNSQAQVRAIMAAQTDRQKRLSYADDVIVNDKSLDLLHQQIDTLHQKYLALANDAKQ